MSRLIYIAILIFMFQACQSDVVYTKYQTIDNQAWSQKNSLLYDIPIKDSLDQYNLFINIRNNNEYAYSNILLITKMTFPDKTKVVDTLEYEMTDNEGQFLGSGFSDIKENKLFYKQNVRFKNTGTYLFEIRQAMRKRNNVKGIDPLQGIKDVGISVEKVK